MNLECQCERLERERDELVAKLAETRNIRDEHYDLQGEHQETTALLGAWKQRAEQAESELTRLRAVEAAALKLISGKGRFHTEQNYKALVEACGRKG